MVATVGDSRIDLADSRHVPLFTDIEGSTRLWEGDAAANKGLVANCLEGFAGVHAVGGEGERAARLLGAADALRIAFHQPIEPPDKADYERFVPSARSRLDEASFTAAWEVGARLSLEEAAELVLAGSKSAGHRTAQQFASAAQESDQQDRRRKP